MRGLAFQICSPLHISHTIKPHAQTPTPKPYGCRSQISGARYIGVVAPGVASTMKSGMHSAIESLLDESCLAHPKSAITILLGRRLLPDKSTLCGFRSLCTIRRSCMCDTPQSNWTLQSNVSFGIKAQLQRCMRPCKLSSHSGMIIPTMPCKQSLTTIIFPCASQASVVTTITAGWLLRRPVHGLTNKPPQTTKTPYLPNRTSAYLTVPQLPSDSAPALAQT